jgi:hypothetical protein
MLKNYRWQYLIVLLPLIIFWGLLFRYAVNVPWFDDVEEFPGTVMKWMQADFTEGFLELFRPNNEHRMLSGKSAAVLCYQLTGELNMRWLILAANLFLTGIFWIFWKNFQPKNLSILFFLPVGLFLFQPQYYLTSNWVITAWQHESVLFFGFLSLYFLSLNSSKSDIWAFLFILICTFSMSNGMFFWLAGGAILGLQKRYKFLAVWLVLMMVSVWLYFYGFDNKANNTGLDYFKQNPHESFFGFFTFLGGSFDFFQHKEIVTRSILPTIMGFGLFCFCVNWAWKVVRQVFFASPVAGVPTSPQQADARVSGGEYFFPNLPANPRQSFLFGVFVFLMINASVIALLRPRFGYFVMLVGNYKIYPALFLVLAYLMFFNARYLSPIKNRTFYILIVISLIFNTLSYWKFTPEVADRRRMMLTNAFNQKNNAIGLAAMINSDFANFTEKTMNFLSENGAYHYPIIFDETKVSGEDTSHGNRVGNGVAGGQLLFPIKIQQKSATKILVENDTFQRGNELNDGAYLLLKSSKRNYLVFAKQAPYMGRNPFGVGKGFSVEIPVNFCKPDTYEIKIYIIVNNKHEIFKTNQSVKIDF